MILDVGVAKVNGVKFVISYKKLPIFLALLTRAILTLGVVRLTAIANMLSIFSNVIHVVSNMLVALRPLRQQLQEPQPKPRLNSGNARCFGLLN